MSKRITITLDDDSINFVHKLIEQGKKEYRGIKKPSEINQSSVIRTLIQKAQAETKSELVKKLNHYAQMVEEIKERLSYMNDKGLYLDPEIREVFDTEVRV